MGAYKYLNGRFYDLNGNEILTTPEELKKECAKYIGKKIPYENGLYYKHGSPVSMIITGVRMDIFNRVDVLNAVEFSDGYTTEPDAYSMDGDLFLLMVNDL